MFQLRVEHELAFKESTINNFIDRAVLWLETEFPDWSSVREQKEKRKLVVDMIDFGKKYEVSLEASIIKLLKHYLDFNFSMNKLYDYELQRLTAAEDSETDRVDAFCHVLKMGQKDLILIDLNSIQGRGV